MSKQPRSKKTKRKPPTQFRFRIDAFTPETMPLQRLAEYLRELAIILGEPKDVHLLAIEGGSTTPVLAIDYESLPKVRTRAELVRTGVAPRDPTAAYDRINHMLKEDNGSAVFQRGKRGARILEFPGREESEAIIPNVKQYGTIEGKVQRVGGSGDEIPIVMESDGTTIVGCVASRQVAKQLGALLFDHYVRLSGMGSWTRNIDGVWELNKFRVDAFEVLKDTPLPDVLAQLRQLTPDWDEKAIEGVIELRRGRK